MIKKGHTSRIGEENDKKIKAVPEKWVQEIDLRGLKSNCNGIVFPPISSTARKLLIDGREMRPPIPGAHPAVTRRRQESQITHGTLFYFPTKAKSPGWDPTSPTTQ